MGLAASWRDSPAPIGAGSSSRPPIAFAILLVCLPSRINIGLRHVLPMYPFLAVWPGWAPSRCGARGAPSPPPAALAVLLVGWQLVASARTHPDYLAYFNELAGRHPERILVDSDLDDGQDLKRLADTLRARRIPAVSLAYAGSATVAEHGLPPIHWLQPHRPVTGWVAVSLYSLKLGSLDRPGHDDFAWLERYRPVALVGSIHPALLHPLKRVRLEPRPSVLLDRTRQQHHDQRRTGRGTPDERPSAANMASSDIPGRRGTKATWAKAAR